MTKNITFFRALILLLSCYLLIAGLLPIFGWQLFLHGPFQLVPLETEIGPLLFLIIDKSAAFLTLTFFALNYLRNRKPLSSVAPLLVYCNFVVFFGLILLYKSEGTSWSHWVTISLLIGCSVILFKENRNESRKIFKNDW